MFELRKLLFKSINGYSQEEAIKSISQSSANSEQQDSSQTQGQKREVTKSPRKENREFTLKGSIDSNEENRKVSGDRISIQSSIFNL
mmetsp:Transcript_6591/g.11126  ORF Transcript_6591/g.11126 Transcript_6591/m.11126 type:complete len:87 (-) Transcript_6591:69-329(-)